MLWSPKNYPSMLSQCIHSLYFSVGIREHRCRHPGESILELTPSSGRSRFGRCSGIQGETTWRTGLHKRSSISYSYIHPLSKLFGKFLKASRVTFSSHANWFLSVWSICGSTLSSSRFSKLVIQPKQGQSQTASNQTNYTAFLGLLFRVSVPLHN